MLQTEGNTDNRQTADNTHHGGSNRQFYPAEQYPKYVQQDRAGGHIAVVNDSAEGAKRQFREFETLQSHRDANYRNAADTPRQKPAQRGKQPAKKNPQNVA